MRTTKLDGRTRRHFRIRQRVVGTAQRPRICIYRSNRHLSAQAVDDQNSQTLASVTTTGKGKETQNNTSCAVATEQGKALGAKLKEMGIESVVFDRSGYRYHGVIKAFADGIRAADEEKHFNF